MEPVEDNDFDIAEPRAEAMIQSLRAFGYDLPTAVADLLDNSISAESRHMWLEFFWDGSNSYVAFIDDGKGMNVNTLKDAMRPGSRSPLEQRDAKDLGRFGLGLKTASFSQCKRLTVGSKARDGSKAIRCWDLDYVSTSKEWRLLKAGSQVFESKLTSLDGKPSGTVVLWEDMDRICGATNVDDDASHELFLSKIEAVKSHVSMVFHRFLEPPKSISIYVNGEPLKPWDPYLSREHATQLLTDEAVAVFGQRLSVRPYVLPHHSKISPEAHKRAAGVHGWNAHQGFYVYRNRRLLVAGDWLGLGFQKEEHYKLARIMLDIPNNMDAEWQIDVKKSRAFPPAGIRKDLVRLAKLTRAKASEIYRFRGARLNHGATELTFLWERRQRHGKIFYEINREHPLVKELFNSPTQTARKARALLSLIEETVPVPAITLDSSEQPDQHAGPFEHVPTATVSRVLYETYLSLIGGGMSSGEAKIRLMNIYPFNQFPELVAVLDENDSHIHESR